MSYGDDHIKFEFNSIEIRLKITDQKNMMTHHTWIWDVKNISKYPLYVISFGLIGDSPKDSSELNVKITDEKNNRLEIIHVKIDKPRRKEFKVVLVTPLEKNQSGLIKLEYDWEEPKRIFEYMLSSKSKKFKYHFSAPKGLQIKPRILEIVPMGDVPQTEYPANIKHIEDRTEIVWETAKTYKIKPYRTFTFCW